MLTLMDVFKVALFNEVRSEAFYTQAAQATDNDEARLWFLELATVEDEHADALVRKARERGFPFDFDPDAYLAELESSTTTTLSAKEEQLFRKGEVGELLHHAKGLEIQSRDDYLFLADGTEDHELQTYFRSLAAQEQRHYDEFCKIEQTLGVAAGNL